MDNNNAKEKTVVLDENGNAVNEEKKSNLGLISMILGIASLVFTCFLSILAPIAIILAIVERGNRQARIYKAAAAQN